MNSYFVAEKYPYRRNIAKEFLIDDLIRLEIIP